MFFSHVLKTEGFGAQKKGDKAAFFQKRNAYVTRSCLRRQKKYQP